MMRIIDLISQADAILLDFDGPLCSLFSDYPASRAATKERELLKAHGIDIPAELSTTTDPLNLLRWAGKHQPTLVADLEEHLVASERTAARTAMPTSHAADVVKAASQSGWRVAVVSNNSAPAVEVYLKMHNLDDYVSVVVGRTPGRPDLMKPNPFPVTYASQLLGVRVGRCLLVGDSVTDIEAARSAGARNVGYAKTSSRVAGLRNAGAEVIIENMGMLARTIPAAAGSHQVARLPEIER
jgi:HAD superfamily hydrolase (TIGR01549 family)